jgi:hypothetical protein
LSISLLNPIQPTIGLAGPFCNAGTPFQLSVNPATGSFVPSVYVNATGLFKPNLASIGNNPVQYIIGTSTCNISDIEQISVEAFVSPTIAGIVPELCVTSLPVNLLPLTTTTLGTWSGPGVTGLLFNPKYFKVTASKKLPVIIYGEDKQRNFTRDVLLVSGIFDGEPLHVLVNHWPSRSGGEKVSDPWRVAAALVCKKACDSLLRANSDAKYAIMGDLNDDPVNTSVKMVLRGKKDKEEVQKGDTFNPSYALYKKGLGTLAYRDAWSLFDQIILSPAWVTPETGGYQYFQFRVHNPAYMTQKSGQYKGYPFRTYVGPNYEGGYSDHFPTYVYMVKKQI